MNILLTGYPGVGKTTVIIKIIQKLKQKQEMKKSLSGFYTEEIRSDNNQRLGFKIKTIRTAKEGLLAHKKKEGRKKVGSYTVLLTEFEKVIKAEFDKETKIVI
ncbi:MAG: nucleoside-triphosphatase, partial [Asgard group archaeon]|nr:nucleoside-triphosphatase [Asgard group archaeon]